MSVDARLDSLQTAADFSNIKLDQISDKLSTANELLQDLKDYSSSIDVFTTYIAQNTSNPDPLRPGLLEVALLSKSLQLSMLAKLVDIDTKLAGTLTIETSTFGSVSVSNSISTPALKVIGI